MLFGKPLKKSHWDIVRVHLPIILFAVSHMRGGQASVSGPEENRKSRKKTLKYSSESYCLKIRVSSSVLNFYVIMHSNFPFFKIQSRVHLNSRKYQEQTIIIPSVSSIILAQLLIIDPCWCYKVSRAHILKPWHRLGITIISI